MKRAKKGRPRLLRRLILTLSLMVFVIQFVNLLFFGSALAFLAETGRLGEIDSFGRTVPILLMALVSLPMGALMALALARIPLRGVDTLVNGMERLAGGQFDERIDLGPAPQEKRISASFNALAEELQNTEMLRSDFVNNFSHEFKTPIVSIRGFAKQLQRDDLSDEQRREYTEIIVSESERLANMASNILLLTKLENQQIVTDKEPYRLDEQMRSCILLLEKQWTAKDMELALDLDEVTYIGNEEMMSHVWVNLLGNAIKFSPEGGELGVRCQRRGNAIEVAIRDHGSGMDEATQKRIFEKFYQGDSAHATEGNGLGLSLVKRIVDLCAGKVAVDSRVGEGTTFTVTLPDPPAARREESASGRRREEGGKRAAKARTEGAA